MQQLSNEQQNVMYDGDKLNLEKISILFWMRLSAGFRAISVSYTFVHWAYNTN
jgi:hypothetical protein